LTSTIINETYGSKLLFKCENFQKAGSFKIRGGIYAAFARLQEKDSDVLAGHSSGNSAQALAKAAMIFGKKAVLVMPENAPNFKMEAFRRYGAEIIKSANSPADREEMMDAYLSDHPDVIFIHPSNDRYMIYGNASCAGEFLEAKTELDNL